jgi:hypothetical protein
VLTWVTASVPLGVGAVSIIVTDRAPQRSAMNSVWPTNRGCVSCVASLLIGIVTTPATSPARAASVAAAT